MKGGSALLPSSAPGFAVDNARKMSPDSSPSIAPTRPSPTETRRASRFNWSGVRGAFVATITMIEPISGACTPSAVRAIVPSQTGAGLPSHNKYRRIQLLLDAGLLQFHLPCDGNSRDAQAVARHRNCTAPEPPRCIVADFTCATTFRCRP